MLNKALLMVRRKEKTEPTLTVKWNTFQPNNDFTVYLTVQTKESGSVGVLLDGMNGDEGYSIPIASLEKDRTLGHFHISNSKSNYGVHNLSVVKAENITYSADLSGYDDYVYCTVESLDKDALFEFNIE